MARNSTVKHWAAQAGCASVCRFASVYRHSISQVIVSGGCFNVWSRLDSLIASRNCRVCCLTGDIFPTSPPLAAGEVICRQSTCAGFVVRKDLLPLLQVDEIMECHCYTNFARCQAWVEPARQKDCGMQVHITQYQRWRHTCVKGSIWACSRMIIWSCLGSASQIYSHVLRLVYVGIQETRIYRESKKKKQRRLLQHFRCQLLLEEMSSQHNHPYRNAVRGHLAAWQMQKCCTVQRY